MLVLHVLAVILKSAEFVPLMVGELEKDKAEEPEFVIETVKGALVVPTPT
jgi:hypothetical protein